MRYRYLLLIIMLTTACELKFHKAIKIPPKIQSIQYCGGLTFKDSVIYNEKILKKNTLNILYAIDSTGCSGCKLQLDKWKLFIEKVHSNKNHNAHFIFIIQAKDIEELKYILINEDFRYPVYLDEHNCFIRTNPHSANNVFLLDKMNKIIYEGNPIENNKTEDIYLSIIEKYNQE